MFRRVRPELCAACMCHCCTVSQCTGLDSTLDSEPHSLGTPLSHFQPKSSSSDPDAANEVATVINIESIKRSLIKEDQFTHSPLPPTGVTTSPSPTKRTFASEEVKLRDKSWRERRRSRERPLSAVLVETAMSPTNKDPPVFLEEKKTPTERSSADSVVPKQESNERTKGEVSLGKETNGQFQSSSQPECITGAVSSDAQTATLEQKDLVHLTGTQALQIFHRRRKARETTSDGTPPTTPEPELPLNGEHPAAHVPPAVSTGPVLLVSSMPVESPREDLTAVEPPAASVHSTIQESHQVQENGTGIREEREEGTEEEEVEEKEEEGKKVEKEMEEEAKEEKLEEEKEEEEVTEVQKEKEEEAKLEEEESKVEEKEEEKGEGKEEEKGENQVGAPKKEGGLRVGPPPRLTTQVSGRSILNDKRMKMLALSLEGTLVDNARQKIDTGRVSALH